VKAPRHPLAPGTLVYHLRVAARKDKALARRLTKGCYALLSALPQFPCSPEGWVFARREKLARVGAVDRKAIDRARTMLVGEGMIEAKKLRRDEGGMAWSGRATWHIRIVPPQDWPSNRTPTAERETGPHHKDSGPCAPETMPLPAARAARGPGRAAIFMKPASMDGLASLSPLRRVAGGAESKPASHPAASSLALDVPSPAACGEYPRTGSGGSAAVVPGKFPTSGTVGLLREHLLRRGLFRGKVGEVLDPMKNGYLLFLVPGERARMLGHVVNKVVWLAEDAQLEEVQ